MSTLKVKVLLVEDSPTDADLIMMALQDAIEYADFSVEWCQTVGDAKRVLGEQDFDVILSDLSLPDADGMQTLELLRASAKGLPIIVLTGLDDKQVAMLAVRGGAQDYLVKNDITSGSLGRAACYAIERRVLSRELAEARDQALQASRHKSEFLANMSHEIRTPMNAIIGMSDLLLRGNLTDDERDQARIISDAAETLLDIVNDILDFSKIEAGKLDIESKDFNLRAAVEGTSDLLSTKARSKGLRLETSVAAELPRRVRGDAGRLRQILVNLAGNAIKFTASGSVTIKVNLEQSSDQPRMHFAVTDTGIGLSEAARLRLFQPYSQADGSIAKKYGGTGLGLSISKRLVELMGGEIGVDSVEGQGSTFWFWLPLVVAESQEGGDHTREHRPEGSLKIAGAEDRLVLVADDNTVNQKVAVAQLRELGLVAHVVATGAEAVEAVAHHSYCLVLMDCDMPDMDGPEATRVIRSKELAANGGEHIPIIALTASALPEDRQRCLDAGMDEYLSKPVGSRKLKEMLERFIGEENAQSDGGQREEPSRLIKRLNSAPIDLEQLAAEYGKDTAEQIVSIFLSSTPELLTKMNELFDARDGVGLKKTVHKLKGACLSIGDAAMTETCQDIESAIGRDEWGVVDETLVKLIGVWRVSEAFLLQARKC